MFLEAVVVIVEVSVVVDISAGVVVIVEVSVVVDSSGAVVVIADVSVVVECFRSSCCDCGWSLLL